LQIDFISILLILGIGQCLFLMGAILINKERAQIANKLLLTLLFAFLWYQVEFFLIRHTLDTAIPFLYSTRYGSWLLVGPLVLLYNRATLIKGYRIRRKDWLHLLPFFLFTLLLPLCFHEVVTDRATHYGMLTVFDKFNQEPITWKHYLYGYVFVIQFLHAAAYILQAYRESRQLEAATKEQRSSLSFERLNTLKYLYLSAFVIVLLCSAFVAYIFLTTMWQRNMDYLYVLPMLVLVFGLAYRAMKYPNSVLIFEAEVEKSQAKYARSGLNNTDRKAHLLNLNTLLTEEKVYRNNELRLSDLAKALNISSHHLSQLLNEEKQQNFFDFINAYRVQEAQERIAAGKGKTLLEIAFAVGFNNKNSFNSAFKKHLGMTPSAYKKTVKDH
jgi:AraC-like DNA-binding protein